MVRCGCCTQSLIDTVPHDTCDIWVTQWLLLPLYTLGGVCPYHPTRISKNIVCVCVCQNSQVRYVCTDWVGVERGVLEIVEMKVASISMLSLATTLPLPTQMEGAALHHDLVLFTWTQIMSIRQTPTQTWRNPAYVKRPKKTEVWSKCC